MQLSPAQQKTYLAFKDRESAEKYKLQCLVFNAKQTPLKRIQQKEVIKPSKPEARPHGSFDNWKQEIKKFQLVKKTCLELKVGDVFKATVEPYFCEIVEILPSEILIDYRLVRLKLLPDGLIGEGVFILLSRVFWVKNHE